MGKNDQTYLLILVIVIIAFSVPYFFGGSNLFFINATILQKVFCQVAAPGYTPLVCQNANDTIHLYGQNGVGIFLNSTNNTAVFSIINSNVANFTFNNLGSGSQVYKNTAFPLVNFRSLIGTNGITTTQNTNDITFSLGNIPWASINKTGSILNDIGSPTSNYDFNAKSLTNVADLNATRVFQGGKQVIDTLNQGTGISITGSGNSRTITNTVTDTNSAQGKNLFSTNGVGQGIYTTNTNATQLQFKSLTCSNGATCSSNGTNINIASGGGGANNIFGQNIGTAGFGPFVTKSGSYLQFKNFTGAGGISLSATGTDITINTSGIPWANISKAGSILNDIGSPTATYSFNGQRLANLGLPISANDAARENTLGNNTLSPFGNPSDGQVLTFQISNNTWIPKTTATALVPVLPADVIVYLKSGLTYAENATNLATISSNADTSTEINSIKAPFRSIEVKSGNYTINSAIILTYGQRGMQLHLDPGANFVVPSGYTGQVWVTNSTYNTLFDGGLIDEAQPSSRLWTAFWSESSSNGESTNTVQNTIVYNSNRVINLVTDSGTTFVNSNDFKSIKTFFANIVVDFNPTVNKGLCCGGINFNRFIDIEAQSEPNSLYCVKNENGTGNEFQFFDCWDMPVGTHGMNILAGAQDTMLWGGLLDQTGFIDGGTNTIRETRYGGEHFQASVFSGKITGTTTSTLAPVNLGVTGTDPSSLVNGDIWINSNNQIMKIQIGGTTWLIPTTARANTFTGANTFSGANSFTHGTNSIAVSNSGLSIANANDQFSTKIIGSALTHNQTLSIPTLTLNATIATLELNQTFTGKNTFTTSSTLAPVNLGVTGTDPSSLVNGDIWINSNNQIMKIQIGGTTWLIPTTARANTFTGANTFSGANSFTHGTNSIAVSNSGLSIANANDKYSTIIKNTNILANQTLTLPFGNQTILSNSSHLYDLADVGGPVPSNNQVLTFQSSNNTWIAANAASGGVTSVTGTTNNVTASPTVGAVTLNLGSNVVVTNGAKQTFTKNLDFGQSTNQIFPSKGPLLRNTAGTFATSFNFTGTLNQTVTIPNGNFTLAHLGVNNQTFTGKVNFTTTAKLAPINLGTQGSDPTNVKPGDVWINSNNVKLKVRIGSTSYLIPNTSIANSWFAANTMGSGGIFDFPFATNTLKLLSGAMTIRNPLETFGYSITGSAITANRTLTLPLTTQTETLAVQPQFNSTTGQLSGNGTGTSSTTKPVMDGVYATITPTVTGRLEITVHGNAVDSTLSDGCRITIQESTSPLGANGVTVAGSLIGVRMITNSQVANAPNTFGLSADATGFTAGTKLYFDLSQEAITGGTCTLSNVYWEIHEY